MREAKVQYYTLICDKKKKRKFHELLSSFGTAGVETVYGKGSANAGAFAQALGFETEEHKVVLSALMTTQKARELTTLLIKEHGFGNANTGIAFSVPVEGLAF